MGAQSRRGTHPRSYGLKGRVKNKNEPVGKILKQFLTNWLKLLSLP